MESTIDGYLTYPGKFSRSVPDDYGSPLVCRVYAGSPTDWLAVLPTVPRAVLIQIPSWRWTYPEHFL